MNIKHAKTAALAIFGFCLLSTPVQATVLNSNPSFPETSISSAVITAGVMYAGYNYLIREDFLVKAKYPMAYAWYQSLAGKYQDLIDFNSINFLQTPERALIANKLTTIAKQCAWLRHENRVYFSKAALKEVNVLYQKVVDGYPLHRNEEQALARYEFMLLHDMGHIYNHDAQTFVAAVAGAAAGAYGAEYAYNHFSANQQEQQADNDKKNIVAGYELPQLQDVMHPKVAHAMPSVLDTLGFPSQIPGILATGKGAAFAASIIGLLRYQEAQADQFACKALDTQTLQDALTLFENDEVDGLFDLENSSMQQHVPAASTVEYLVQRIVEPIEYGVSFAAQQVYLLFKTHPAMRWVFDFTQNAIHQGPSVRAQLIKDEIAQRAA